MERWRTKAERANRFNFIWGIKLVIVQTFLHTWKLWFLAWHYASIIGVILLRLSPFLFVQVSVSLNGISTRTKIYTAAEYEWKRVVLWLSPWQATSKSTRLLELPNLLLCSNFFGVFSTALKLTFSCMYFSIQRIHSIFWLESMQFLVF